jgi:hypothetical protein
MYMMMKEEHRLCETTIDTKNINTLQNDIKTMIRQIVDLNPRQGKAATILEGLRQIISSSEEKWHC